MTRIDFYVLQKDSEQDRLEFAARLCEKAYRQDMTVMILTADPNTATQMDALLWDFKPESFVPHADIATADQAREKVLISSGDDNINHHGLLINLGFEVPKMFSRFQRVAEVVVQTESTLKATREHYGFYRARGYPVNSHKI